MFVELRVFGSGIQKWMFCEGEYIAMRTQIGMVMTYYICICMIILNGKDKCMGYETCAFTKHALQCTYVFCLNRLCLVITFVKYKNGGECHVSCKI